MRNRTPIRRRQAQRGYSSMELVVALVVLGVLVQGYLQWRESHRHAALIERTVDSVLQIQEAAYAYRVEKEQWPTRLEQINGYLPNWTNADGLKVVFHPPGDNKLGLIIDIEMADAKQAHALARAFPATGQFKPGIWASIGTAEPGINSKYELIVRRDGTESMTGNLNFAGHAVSNVGAIESTTVQNRGAVNTDQLKATQRVEAPEMHFSETRTDGSHCSGRSVAFNAAGELMTCVADRQSPDAEWQVIGAEPEPEPEPEPRSEARTGSGRYGTRVSPISGFTATECRMTVSGLRFSPPAVYKAVPVSDGWTLSAEHFVCLNELRRRRFPQREHREPCEIGEAINMLPAQGVTLQYRLSCSST